MQLICQVHILVMQKLSKNIKKIRKIRKKLYSWSILAININTILKKNRKSQTKTKINNKTSAKSYAKIAIKKAMI